MKSKKRILLIGLFWMLSLCVFSQSNVTKQYNWNGWFTGWIRGDSAFFRSANITKLTIGNSVDATTQTYRRWSMDTIYWGDYKYRQFLKGGGGDTTYLQYSATGAAPYTTKTKTAP